METRKASLKSYLINSYRFGSPYIEPGLYIIGLNATSHELYWEDVGATNYVVERSTDAGFAGATQIYSGPNKNFSDTGLTPNTTYFYRVKSQRTGQTDSPWTTGSRKTFVTDPVYGVGLFGLNNPNDNAYANTTGANIDVIKNLFGAANDATLAGGTLAVIEPLPSGYAMELNNSNGFYGLASNVVLSGDFTICWTMRRRGTINNNTIIGGSATAYVMQLTATSTRCFLNTVFYDFTHASIPADSDLNFMVFRRQGTTLSFWLNGVKAADQTCVTSSLTLNRLFASPTGTFIFGHNLQSLFVFNSALTEAQFNEYRDYLKEASYTPTTTTDVYLNDLTWSDLTGTGNRYLVDSTLQSASMGSINRVRAWRLNNRYNAFLVHKKNDTTFWLEDAVFYYDKQTNRVSNRIDLGVPLNNTDVHNNGSIFVYDNRLFHIEQNTHYNAAGADFEKTIIKTSGNRFYPAFVNVPTLKGIDAIRGSDLQYHLINVINGVIYIVAQEYRSVTYSTPTRLVLLWSTDRGVSFNWTVIADTLTADEFLYGNICWDAGTNKIRLFMMNIANSLVRYRYLFYAECDVIADGPRVWKNIQGTFTKTTSERAGITYAELQANYQILNYTATTGQAKAGFGVYSTATGKVYAIAGNSNLTGLLLLIGDSTGWTSRALDPLGRTLVNTWTGFDGDNVPIVYEKGGGVLGVICHEDNGGNWTIVEYETADEGLNWTFVTTHSTDSTKKHNRLTPDFNRSLTDFTIYANRVDGTTGDVFIKKLL